MALVATLLSRCDVIIIFFFRTRFQTAPNPPPLYLMVQLSRNKICSICTFARRLLRTHATAAATKPKPKMIGFLCFFFFSRAAMFCIGNLALFLFCLTLLQRCILQVDATHRRRRNIHHRRLWYKMFCKGEILLLVLID